MSKYFTKENIALFLSVVSIVLSVASFTRTLINEYVRLKVTYISHFVGERGNEAKIMLFMTVTNQSRLPVSLSSAFLEINNGKYQFDWRPEEVMTETTRIGNKIVDRKVTYTINMPQTLLGLGVIGGYFGVKTDLSAKLIENNPSVNLIIHTNKKILKYPITLDKNEYN